MNILIKLMSIVSLVIAPHITVTYHDGEAHSDVIEMNVANDGREEDVTEIHTIDTTYDAEGNMKMVKWKSEKK